MAIGVRIAPGHNNSAGLKFLWELSSPMFKAFIGDETVLTEWHDVVDQELDGNREWVDIGLPYVVWTLFRVSRAEFAYLKDTFANEVTIQTLDQGNNEYHIYNATMKPLRSGNDSGTWTGGALQGWENLKLEYYDLEQTA